MKIIRKGNEKTDWNKLLRFFITKNKTRKIIRRDF